MINLFKDNEGFCYSNFRGKIVDGIEQIPEEIQSLLLQVDEQTFKDLQNHKLMWQNGELVENPDYETYLQEQEIKSQQRALNLLRQKRKPLLNAFDIYKSNVSYGVIEETGEEHNQITAWYQSILDLDETALDNVPNSIKRYL